MDNNTIYIVLGILLVVYFATQAFTKKRWKERKSRGFMEGQRKKKNHDEGDKRSK